MTTLTYCKGLPTPASELTAIGYSEFELFLMAFSGVFERATIETVNHLLNKQTKFNKSSWNTHLQKTYGISKRHANGVILTQDACSFYEDHSLFDDYTGVVLELEEGQRIAQALGEKKAIILRNHGLLTVGHSVDEAAWLFVAMERSCQAQLMAEAAGTPILIDSDNARLTQRLVGSHQVGWFSFQPLYELIVNQQPELLE